jgi:hypothetical protein
MRIRLRPWQDLDMACPSAGRLAICTLHASNARLNEFETWFKNVRSLSWRRLAGHVNGRTRNRRFHTLEQDGRCVGGFGGQMGMMWVITEGIRAQRNVYIDIVNL